MGMAAVTGVLGHGLPECGERDDAQAVEQMNWLGNPGPELRRGRDSPLGSFNEPLEISPCPCVNYNNSWGQPSSRLIHGLSEVG